MTPAGRMTPDPLSSPEGPAVVCSNCAHDLTGLEPLRPCPGCGCVFDAPGEVTAARRWFAEEAWKPWKCLRESRIPVALWHALGDEDSRRIARRRRRLCLLLPCICAGILVLGGDQLERRLPMSVVWRPIGMPAATPLHQTSLVDAQRPFSGRRGSYDESDPIVPPLGAERTVESGPRGAWSPFTIRPHLPTSPRVLTLGLVPWLVSIFGFHTTSALLRRLVGCSGTRDTDAFVLEISTVIAPAYGFLLWIYLPLLVATAVAELTNGLYSWIGTATARGFTVIFGCWITISVFGWVAITRLTAYSRIWGATSTCRATWRRLRISSRSTI